MKRKLLAFIKILLPFSLLLLALQFVVVNFLFEVSLYYSSLSIYAFHFIATLFIYGVLVFIHQNFKEKAGFAFMGLSLVKMLAAILFLLPVILNVDTLAFTNIIAFFIPYFLYLIFETFFAVKLISAE